MRVPAAAHGLARFVPRLIEAHAARWLGARAQHEIAPGYRHRDRIAFYDDTANADEWQREVYQAARALMIERELGSVIDVGTGSGYKLVHYLGQFETTGLDLPPTVAWLRGKYPDRTWLELSLGDAPPATADLVVCADVIEHVADPDALMRTILAMAKEWVVLSTPDRDLTYSRFSAARFGPPSNPAHVREWTMPEFRRFAGRYLVVERHEISNRGQATQLLIGRVRR